VTADPAADGPPPLDRTLAAAVANLYDELSAEIARHAPVCVLSGRCCRFREYDHTLFLSGVEAAYLLAHAPAPARPLDTGDTCPWQDAAGRCSAREARPLGCRIYFCDPAFAEVMPELSESFLARLKALTAAARLPWDYAPLHAHLSRHAGLFSGAVQEMPEDDAGGDPEPARPQAP
jgi:Fe-S-cluster containining protein